METPLQLSSSVKGGDGDTTFLETSSQPSSSVVKGGAFSSTPEKKIISLSEENTRLHIETTFLRSEKLKLKNQIYTLEEQIYLNNYNIEILRGRDHDCKYFTGLTWIVFSKVCKYLAPNMTAVKNLSPTSQLMMVLVKLRLDLNFEFMAHQTRLALSTVSVIFWRWIELINSKLGFLIQWPDRGVIMKTVPPLFKEKFPKITSIIDCFEIFINRPKNLKARAQVYSNYKKHSTIKFLIACHPLGAVTFLSKAWGGRATDCEIVRESGFISHRYHYPGDQILADRGFTLQDDFAVQCQAELVMPAFTKGKKQLSAKEVEITRKIANIRIHIERVIGLIKNRYNVLRGPISIPFIKSAHDEREDQEGEMCSIDKLVTVCAVLINLSTGIVYKE